MENGQRHIAPNISTGPGLFITDETRALLAQDVLDSLAAGAPRNKHIVIVGADDLAGGRPTSNLRDHFSAAGIHPHSRAMEILNNYSSFLGMAGEMATSLLGARFNFTQWNMGDKQTYRHIMPNDSCLITFPMHGEPPHTDTQNGIFHYDYGSAQGIAESLLMLPPGKLERERIPSKDNRQNVQTWLAHHESDHCRNAIFGFYEFESDTHANRQYAVDLAAGRTNDPEFPYYMRSMRAGAFMLGASDNVYALNGLTPMAGEKPITNKERVLALQEIAKMRMQVYQAIEKEGNALKEILAPESRDMQAKLVYEQTRLMTQRGDFDNLPYGKMMAERFLDGAQRYGHELYGVAPEDRIFSRPDMPPQAYGLPGSAPIAKTGPAQEIRF